MLVVVTVTVTESCRVAAGRVECGMRVREGDARWIVCEQQQTHSCTSVAQRRVVESV